MIGGPTNKGLTNYLCVFIAQPSSRPFKTPLRTRRWHWYLNMVSNQSVLLPTARSGEMARKNRASSKTCLPLSCRIRAPL